MPSNELDELAKRNHTRLMMLHAEGARIEPVEMITFRLEAFIDFVFEYVDENPETGVGRGTFDLMFQKRFESLLDEAHAQLNKAKLTQGVDEFQMPTNPRDN